ncbi:TIGR03960 family B12-binding radical SAM protein [bacterium]|nr:TIGR03960 family B12-binding radical SAM protein [bacterium]
MESIEQKLDSVLPDVTRPGRYLGNEIHIIRKKWQNMEVHFALAFPDVYEIGMSHTGMSILYHILNRFDWIAAERVYAPWIDMEQKMRQARIPLFSLESKKPIRLFDILGFSLQYELHYTNVLNMIDLAGISLRSRERKDKDPIVIAGGPCAFNPEPLARFLDAVVLGDGEEVVTEIADVVRQSKRNRINREETLKTLSKLDGVYIPSHYSEALSPKGSFTCVIPNSEQIRSKVRARILDSLLPINYPCKPLVPLIEVIHDRFSMEIMRGCTRGCRFCNAGIIYRPIREKSVDDLIKEAKTVIENTGYDEISLLSLSASDYSDLSKLLYKLKTTFCDKEVSISFPSLRADSFTPEMIDLVDGLRRTSLTFALEAGTQRLRNVINKDIQEEDLLHAVEMGFKRNWTRVKLYFMIGLPSETMEDIQGIVNVVWQAVKIGRKYGRKEIVVSISPFSPKPHTPFQWESQDSLEIMNKKIFLLKEKIKWPEVNMSWRNPQVSQLEAVLGRGNRRIGEVIYQAWKEGAKFDAWSDQFCYDHWIRAFQKSGISIEDYTRKRNIQDPLPWDHLDKGVTKTYLIQEKERALSEMLTEDCRFTQCIGCGLLEHPQCKVFISSGRTATRSPAQQSKELIYGRKIKHGVKSAMKMKLRLRYRKGDEVRFTSHLDLIRIFTRALRRAHVPLVYSQGYHRHPKMGTCPPLPLGFTSQAEYLDLDVMDYVDRDFKSKMNRYLPLGLEIIEHKFFLRKLSPLNRSIDLASYFVEWGDQYNKEDMDSFIGKFMKKNAHCVMVHRGKNVKELDIRDSVVEMSQNGKGIRLVVRFGLQGTPRLDEVMQAVFSDFGNLMMNRRVERTGLYIDKQGTWISPLDIE